MHECDLSQKQFLSILVHCLDFGQLNYVEIDQGFFF